MKYISFRIKENFHQDDVLDKNMKTELSLSQLAEHGDIYRR